MGQSHTKKEVKKEEVKKEEVKEEVKEEWFTLNVGYLGIFDNYDNLQFVVDNDSSLNRRFNSENKPIGIILSYKWCRVESSLPDINISGYKCVTNSQIKGYTNMTTTTPYWWNKHTFLLINSTDKKEELNEEASAPPPDYEEIVNK